VRVSDLQKQRVFSSNIQDRLVNLTRVQQEMGTGKSLFTTSEDVGRADQALRTRELIASDAQFTKNIDDGREWVNSADSSLQGVVDLLNEIDSLAVQADNSSQNAEDRQATAVQIDQKLESLMELVNSRHGDRYLFGGFSTTTSPFTANRDANGHIQSVSANAETITGKIYRQISSDDRIQVNISGSQLFQPSGQEGTDADLFYVVGNLRDTIANNNTPPTGSETTLSNEHLRDQLASIRNRITEQQTYLGTIGQRLDQTKARLKDREVTLTDRLEQAQGVDMTDLVTRLSTEQGAYDALATMGTSLLKQSLVDYLG
jgi:flagellar hook-associated protein 3 FlgL